MEKQYLVTASEMRELDQQTIQNFGIPGMVLMENAGRTAIDYFCHIYSDILDKRIGVLCGSGNNGGDGFVMARYLLSAGIDTIIYLCTSEKKLKGDAKINYDRLVAMNAPVIEIIDDLTFHKNLINLETRNIWIDALLGTGLRSDVRGVYQSIIKWLNRTYQSVFSVDIPSGLNADTGYPCGICVNAEATITFGHVKIGLVMPTGSKYCGELAVADIGIPETISVEFNLNHYLLDFGNVSDRLLYRAPEAHKGTTGHVLVVGGSTGKTGACAMTAQSAMRIGCGLVTLGIAQSLNAILETQLMEVMTLPLPEEKPGILGPSALDLLMKASTGKKCMAIGPGIGRDPKTVELVLYLIQESTVPMVIDADALNAISDHLEVLQKAKSPIILTPHPGEMSRLTDLSVKEIQSDRVGISRKFATDHNVYLVLKGEKTIVAHPDGMLAINPTGNSGMATGGMGDVLTGIIAGVIAQGVEPGQAVETSVFLHGLAGDLMAKHFGYIGFMATDIMEFLPKVLKECWDMYYEQKENNCISSQFCEKISP